MGSGDNATLETLIIQNLPSGIGFRPHGIYIDNSTQRLFVISHSETLKEEQIIVFDIVEKSHSLPILDYKFALKSPTWPWYNYTLVWFLNDLVVSTSNELYTTQCGPFTPAINIPRHVFRCTWNNSATPTNGYLTTSCTSVYTDVSAVKCLNGITINNDKTQIWVNNLPSSEILHFQRLSNGSLVQNKNINLTVIVDNLEYDFGSGKIFMGVASKAKGPLGLVNYTKNPYGIMYMDTTSMKNDITYLKWFTEQPRTYGASAMIQYRKYTIIAAPYANKGPMICVDDAHTNAPTNPPTTSGSIGRFHYKSCTHIIVFCAILVNAIHAIIN